MITTQLHWRGPQMSKQTENEAWRLVLLATNLVRGKAVALVSKPAIRIRKRRKRTTSKGPAGSQYTVFIGSKPGEPPQVRRSFGRRSIDIEMFRPQLMTHLGVRKNAAYMAYLEVGTSRVRARPWLRPALQASQAQIKALKIR